MSSIQHPLSKKWKSLLQESKKRRELGSFIVEGPKLAGEALHSGCPIVESVVTQEFVRKPQNRSLVQVLRQRKVPEHFIEQSLMNKISETEEPQGVLLVLRQPAAQEFQAWLAEKPRLVLMADGLQDPGNLGTLLRSAWAAAADGVILGQGCTDPWSPKVLRAGSGAQLHVKVFSGMELPKALKDLKQRNIRCVATSPKADVSYLDLDLKPATCFVLGAEGQGLSQDLINQCDEQVKIPYPGKAESLNVAVSGTLLLFETLRQRQSSPK